VLNAAAQNNRVEQILVWKVSEELGLSAKEEKKLSEIVSKINEKKSTFSSAIENNLRDLREAVKANKKTNLFVKLHTENLQKLNQLNLDEIKEVRKALGEVRLARYLLIKSDLSQRVKMLLQSNTTDNKNINSKNEAKAENKTPENGRELPEPQFIIEN
jgi:hypothetical protein